jgi:hypothetical protein
MLHPLAEIGEPARRLDVLHGTKEAPLGTVIHRTKLFSLKFNLHACLLMFVNVPLVRTA